MKIEYIYSACIVITTDDCKILCDPWFTQGLLEGLGTIFHIRRLNPKILVFVIIFTYPIFIPITMTIVVKDYLNIYSDSKIITANWFRSNPLFMKMKRDGIVNHEVDEWTIKVLISKFFHMIMDLYLI